MNSKNKRVEVVIVGAGGHGSEVHSYFRDLPPAANVKLMGFIDDNQPPGAWLDNKILGGLEALEMLAQKGKRGVLHYITAIGSNPVRRKIVDAIETLGLKNLRPWTLRHPTVQIGYGVEIAEGTLLAPNVVVTTRVRIGRHGIINIRASVSHDCKIGDFVNINPAATLCGNVTVGDGSYIGAGAVIKEKIKIGRGVTVGAGAVVIRDLPDGSTAVGVPARIIKQNPEMWPATRKSGL
jgi:acetyltransferase EpsM